MTEIYQLVAETMQGLGCNYAPEQWETAVRYPYFVGSYEVLTASYEAGRETGVFTIDGWNRGPLVDFLNTVNRVTDTFKFIQQTINGHLVSMGLDGVGTVPTGESDLFRVTIRLYVMDFMEE